jgi:hypothetical protein
VYKLGRTHVVIDALSRLPNVTKPIGVPNQTIDASLFYIRPKWLNDVNFVLKTKQIKGTLSLQWKQRLVKKTKPFTLKNGELYKMGQNNKPQRCLTGIEAQMVMKELHEGPLKGHFAIEIT